MIVFIWDGFPQYAARCVGALAKSVGEKVVVVASRPTVPIKGMERACGCEIHWIDYKDNRSIKEIVGEMPRLAVVSGWFSQTINRWRDEVCAAGGKVFAMCDNNWHGFSLRELAKAIRFRLLFRGKYDGFFVPGKSGVKLLRFYGAPESRISMGLYAADARVFHDGQPLSEREKKIICVARFIDWKNAKRLMQAFAKACRSAEGWKLELYGSGPMKDELLRLSVILNAQISHFKSCITLNDFLQPEQLSEKYREARIFCLPSLNEHWGLVVHEAALSGCVLLLSKNVGSAADFLDEGQNGLSFDPYDVDNLANALSRVMTANDTQLAVMHERSLKMAGNASLEKFCNAVNVMRT